MIISRSIHVAVNGIISFFLWLSNIPSHICMCGGAFADWWASLVCGWVGSWLSLRTWGPYLWTFFFFSVILFFCGAIFPSPVGLVPQGRALGCSLFSIYLPVLNLAAHPLPSLCWIPLHPGLSASVSPHSESPVSSRRWGRVSSL